MIDLKMFSLIERLEPRTSAQARLFVWDGAQYVPASEVVKVYDHLGHYGVAGECGRCILSKESGNWEVFYGLNMESNQLRM
jgi:hypothetical protein